VFILADLFYGCMIIPSHVDLFFNLGSPKLPAGRVHYLKNEDSQPKLGGGPHGLDNLSIELSSGPAY
jgi:hypothetical protein